MSSCQNTAAPPPRPLQCLPVVTGGNCRGSWTRAGPPEREDNVEDRDSAFLQYIQGFHDDEEEMPPTRSEGRLRTGRDGEHVVCQQLEEDHSPSQEDEEQPKLTCAHQAVTVCFLCGGSSVKLLTHTEEASARLRVHKSKKQTQLRLNERQNELKCLNYSTNFSSLHVSAHVFI